MKHSPQQIKSGLFKYDGFFETVFMHNPIPMLIIDLTSHSILLANYAAIHRYGYTAEEFEKMTVFDLHPGDEHHKLAAFLRIRENTYQKSSNWQHLCKDGKKMYVDIISHRIKLGDLTVVLAAAIDISKRIDIIQELEASQKQYLSIINNQNQLICKFLPDTTLTFVNSAYCKIFGKTEEELIGTRFIELIPAGQRNQSLSMIKQLCPDNAIATNTFDAVLPDGSIGWQEWTDIAFFDKEGNIIDILGIGRDISKYKNIEISLRNALRLEKHMSELKTHLLYMASHEFKMPLSTVMATAESIKAYSDKMDQNEFVESAEKIIRQVLYLDKLVKDVLLMAKERTGKMEFDPKQTDIISFLKDIAEEFSLSNSFKHRLQLELPEEEYMFTFDHSLMYKIVSNLLSNAARFSKEDSAINLRLDILDNELILTITDSGYGIPDHQKAQLFEPFFRGDNVQEISGTGLGLPIVKEAVELHSGSIEIDSSPGKGTTVVVRFPINKS